MGVCHSLPATGWQLVQGVRCLSLCDRWKRLQPPRPPPRDTEVEENGWIAFNVSIL